MTFNPPPATNPNTAIDVWGRPVAVGLKSLFSDVFTYGISDKWRNDGGTNSSIDSDEGQLVLHSGTAADTTHSRLASLETSRYQPNRGHVYSTASQAMGQDSGTIYRWGLFTDQEGVFFKADTTAQKVYAVRRKTSGVTFGAAPGHSEGTGGSTVDEEEEIDLDALGLTWADAAINRLWDIQFQWRGSGNIEFLIDQEVAYTFERLGVDSDLSIRNPALPVAWEVENTGATSDQEMRFGCVDVSSQGGDRPEYKPRTVATPALVDISGPGATDVPLVALQAQGFLQGVYNTRNNLAAAAEASGDVKGIIKVYRNPTITVSGGSWSDVDPASGLRQFVGDGTDTIAGGELVAIRQFAAASGSQIDLLKYARENMPAWTHPVPGADTLSNEGDPAFGEILCITVERDNGGNISATASLTVGEAV